MAEQKWWWICSRQRIGTSFVSPFLPALCSKSHQAAKSSKKLLIPAREPFTNAPIYEEWKCSIVWKNKYFILKYGVSTQYYLTAVDRSSVLFSRVLVTSRGFFKSLDFFFYLFRLKFILNFNKKKFYYTHNLTLCWWHLRYFL